MKLKAVGLVCECLDDTEPIDFTKHWGTWIYAHMNEAHIKTNIAILEELLRENKGKIRAVK